ncbi:tRNA (uridine(54)-C5)-methyltransferase TrmA [Aestuariibacter salexigens]|uniref:tRNA (uridine(54)-C5)-methyltransferase TrmA n=1 Tax=Aestuariibacter salexigens TaxID=226010 RepID=UPI0003FF69DA|nr:tRNA (uridine(54)-C5)-methyltransferase TrmA [Aestuariibacter salexigens]
MRLNDIDVSTYQAQLDNKKLVLQQQFARFSVPEIEVYASPVEHFRMRAEFRVWHDGDDLYHIMFDQNTKQKYRVDQFPIASTLINQVMSSLLDRVRMIPVLRRKLFQIDYLSTLSGEIVVSLLYHKPLDDEWQQAAEALLTELRQQYRIDIVGRARKQKCILHRDYVVENLTVNDRQYMFKQAENSFTQPNAQVNIRMICWTQSICQDLSGDLLELYCGAGNFSIPLAGYFDNVLATEISKTSVAAAQFNIKENNVDNVSIIRLSSEEFVQAMRGERQFKRLEGVDLATYQCNTVLVDPPRSGLDHTTLNLVSEYDNIIYISCNPETLADNLDSLTQTHDIKRFALFDQFPYTHHAECGVYLSKR